MLNRDPVIDDVSSNGSVLTLAETSIERSEVEQGLSRRLSAYLSCCKRASPGTNKNREL
jgi:hypothetical protein